MTLKYVVDSLDTVEEAVRSLYVANPEGGFKLAVDGVDDAAELKRAKAHEVEARKKAEKELKELRDAQKASDEEARLAREEAARKSGDAAALERSWTEKMNKALADKEAEYQPQVQSLQGDVERLLIDNVAQSMAGSIAIQGSEALLIPHIKARLRVEVRDGQRTTVVVDAAGKPSAATLDDLKKEFAGNKAFAPVIVGSKASGGGAGGAGGGGAPHNLKRSTMSNAVKAAYIEEHGKDAFFKLPD